MNLICGINPVLEALASGTRHFERLLVVKGLRNRRISEAISRAIRSSVPLRFETRETLDRIAGGVPHQALEALKARGVWVVGFDAAGTERWDRVDLKRPVALVVGGEGRGIRRLVREQCDHLASIPLFGHVDSINVSVAAGIALFEAIRQRGAVPSHVRPIPARPSSPQIGGPGPGDLEHDPGAVPGPVTDGVHGPEPEDDEHEIGEPMNGVVEFHEEAAWAGPTVLKPAGFAR